jgi:hypothetical protein
MSKFFRVTRTKAVKLPIAFLGSVALLTLVSVRPGAAGGVGVGVPAGLLRLDSSAVFSDEGQQLHAVDQRRLKSRHAFARARRTQHYH